MLETIFGLVVLLVVATVVANLLSGGVHNDLSNPRHPAAKKLSALFNRNRTSNKKVPNVASAGKC